MKTGPAPQPRPARGAAAREGVVQPTREALLKAATKVFARHGYDGGSLEKISSLAQSHDRMIYYYFGSKEALFLAVLEDIYRRMDEAEAKCEVSPDDPVGSLRNVIRFKVNFYRNNPDFVTLLNAENMLKGRHAAKSERAVEYSSRAVTLIADLLEAGEHAGVFRTGLKARDVYLLIVATSYFFTSNRYTLSAFLGEPIAEADAVTEWEEFVCESVLRVVRRESPTSAVTLPSG